MARLSTVHSTSISGVNNSANLGDPVPLTSARYGEFSPKKSGKSSQMRPALSKVAPIGQILKNYACSSLRFVLNDKKDDEQRQDKMSQ